LLSRKDFPFRTKLPHGSRFPRRNVEDPDLATLKDFFRFHAATSKGNIVERTISNSLNTFVERFFAGFSRVTGTPIDTLDKHESLHSVA
jgi:hypothetical protein